MIVSARPVHFTARLPELEAICAAMGLPRVEGSPGKTWQVFGGIGAGGAVAVHGVGADDPLAGTTALGFEADDIDAVLAGFSEGGMGG